MARPIKDGVDYFPKDTDFYTDDKVRLLRAEFGAKGMYILDYLLCDLYGKNGYFIKWDKNKCFLVSDGAGCGCSPDFISEFIDRCVACSFFNERVFNMFGVLTSEGIQRRYIRMFNSREQIQIIKEFWLLNMDDKKDVPAKVLNKLAFKNLKSTENPDKSTENPFKNTGNTQNKKKVKDTYVSQNKNKFSVFANGNVELLNALKNYEEMRKVKKRPMTDKSREMLLDKLLSITSDVEEQIKCLDKATYNCWMSVYPDNNKSENKAVYAAYDLDAFEKMLNEKE